MRDPIAVHGIAAARLVDSIAQCRHRSLHSVCSTVGTIATILGPRSAITPFWQEEGPVTTWASRTLPQSTFTLLAAVIAVAALASPISDGAYLIAAARRGDIPMAPIEIVCRTLSAHSTTEPILVPALHISTAVVIGAPTLSRLDVIAASNSRGSWVVIVAAWAGGAIVFVAVAAGAALAAGVTLRFAVAYHAGLLGRAVLNDLPAPLSKLLLRALVTLTRAMLEQTSLDDISAALPCPTGLCYRDWLIVTSGLGASKGATIAAWTVTTVTIVSVAIIAASENHA